MGNTDARANRRIETRPLHPELDKFGDHLLLERAGGVTTRRAELAGGVGVRLDRAREGGAQLIELLVVPLEAIELAPGIVAVFDDRLDVVTVFA